MNIWHKNNEKPMPYKILVMEFDKPFGDQLPKEEQDAVYECYEMRYYGDGNGREWQALKQCNRWAYLDELVSDNEEKTAKIHILTESQMSLENTIGELGDENTKLKHLVEDIRKQTKILREKVTFWKNGLFCITEKSALFHIEKALQNIEELIK